MVRVPIAGLPTVDICGVEQYKQPLIYVYACVYTHMDGAYSFVLLITYLLSLLM